MIKLNLIELLLLATAEVSLSFELGQSCTFRTPSWITAHRARVLRDQ